MAFKDDKEGGQKSEDSHCIQTEHQTYKHHPSFQSQLNKLTDM